MRHELFRCETREVASGQAARLVAGALQAAIEDKGRASFLVSGGSTPGPMFDLLASTDLAWNQVTVGLVDERWVDPEHAASNERQVRERLLRRFAGAAGFVPMRTLDASPDLAVADRQLAYAPHCAPADVILLGMGNDGHTASWFPDSAGLDEAMLAPAGQVIAAIDATGCPVAGNHAHRLTLTGPAVTQARTALMLLFGDEKLAVFERALTADPRAMPVRHAIDKLGPRLSVIWAP